MKAWVLNQIGEIKYEDVTRPVPAEGEVLLRVRAAGICGSDIPRVYQTGAHKMPLIPGHEFSGVVETVGPGVDERWLNKPVGVFPLIPCRKCEPCRHGHFELCRSYDYVGSRRDGAFGEFVTVPAANLMELPEGVSFEEAAMLEPMAVAVHAMRKGIMTGEGENAVKLPLDAKVAVCGLGTIGLLLVMFLLEEGYHNLYVIGNKAFQKEKAAKLGISPDRFCDSKTENVTDWLREKASGLDLYFECVGRNESINYGLDAAAPEGRIVLVGNPAGDMEFGRDMYWKILRNQLTLRGTWNSSCGAMDPDLVPFDDWGYVIGKLREHRISPRDIISHTFPLEGLEQGLLLMRDKKEDYGKVMILP